jgi:ribonuclease VapC
MIVDTSALVAILQDEPERTSFIDLIDSAAALKISAVSFVEVSRILESRYGAEGLLSLDRFLDRAGIEVVAVDARQAIEARRAFSRFGKGRHPAGLNFGDCFSYALSVCLGEPLLFKGDDFGVTDIVPATPAPR